ncbi:N-acetylneuraminate synthase family protein [Oceanospirillaceae bacterium]|nr:N-acetylneuraminate synthase family protein [Oceanospirillaceae bacterium]
MIFTKNISSWCVSVSTNIADVLRQLENEKHRSAICVDDHGHLMGVFSLGDLNRWIVKSDKVELRESVDVAMNPDPKVCLFKTPFSFDPAVFMGLEVVPVVDEVNRLVGLIENNRGPKSIEIGGISIGAGKPPFIIAEIGNNHNGSLTAAKHLIDLAYKAGAHCAKFQLRNMDELYGDVEDDCAENLGAQYTLDLLKRFQLSNKELLEALEYSSSLGLIPLCTPWDEASVDFLESVGVPAFKVASADLTNHSLLRYISAMGKPVICSTGMATEQEIKASVDVLQRCGAQFILLHCNSTYPAPFKDINLSYMPRLSKIGDCLVGYSGHERDINVAIAAAALGATVIEKHFTNDRTLEGNDHKVSLLPVEFERMVSGINQVHSALGQGGERTLSQGELMNRVTLAKSIYAKRSMKKGELIRPEDLVVKSPGRGLQPNYMEILLSKPLVRDIEAGEVFYLDHISGATIAPRADYAFWSKWGIPVRHHDYKNLHALVNSPMLEFHLSYKDLDLDHDGFFPRPVDAELVVHAPELFFGDHTLDLSSPDIEYRKHSIDELRRTMTVVKTLKPYFNNRNKKIGLVTNVGGFSDNSPLPASVVRERIQILKESLRLLQDEDVEIWPQTMPPFPWHFGGQQFHNLFLSADSIVEFCKEMKMKVCLDVSHSALECNHSQLSLSVFLEKVLPYTAHLHLADASGLDGEGLQIHEGGVDWAMVANKMKQYCPEASWLPEIWQGHENNGQGFWVAFERLEKEGF